MRKSLFVLLLSLLTSITKAQTDSLFVTTSDSVKLFVKRSGKGMPVLFIHGGPGSNSLYFELEGGNVFEKDVQMIYLDQRGCGRSSLVANNNYSLERVVQDFEEVRKALGISQWVLMPHSFGGILATEYAYKHPSASKALVYLNCTIDLHASAKAGIQKTIALLPNLKKEDVAYLQNESNPLLERWGRTFWYLSQNNMRHTLMFDKKESYQRDSTLMQREGLHWELGQNFQRYPEYFTSFSTKTSAIKTPVLIISGTRDFAIGVDHPKLMRFPNKEVKYIPGGHALYLEHNKELYNAVKPFLLKYSRRA